MILPQFCGGFFFITCVSRLVHINPESVDINARFGIEESLKFPVPILRDIWVHLSSRSQYRWSWVQIRETFEVTRTKSGYAATPGQTTAL